jgi:hypothetical protein
MVVVEVEHSVVLPEVMEHPVVEVELVQLQQRAVLQFTVKDLTVVMVEHHQTLQVVEVEQLLLVELQQLPLQVVVVMVSPFMDYNLPEVAVEELVVHLLLAQETLVEVMDQETLFFQIVQQDQVPEAVVVAVDP